MSHTTRRSFLIVVAVSASLSASAQDSRPIEARLQALEQRYEQRIKALEDEVQTLRGSVAERDEAIQGAAADQAVEQQIGRILSAGTMGRLDQTTRYDNRFNPAFGVVADFIGVASNQRDSYDFHDRFQNRGAELNILGRIDPYGYYTAVIHAKPDEVELEEAYGVVDQGLPDTFSIRGGKFHYDFGKLGASHEHELPFVDTPAVFQEYFGGAPSGVGVEVHHWFGIGDIPIRWSVGMMNDPAGDSDSVVGPLTTSAGEPASTVGGFGRRGAENFAYHARATTLFEVAENHTLQFGLSAMWAPEVAIFMPDPIDPTIPHRTESDHLVLGFDFAWQWHDASRDDWFDFGTEVLFNDEKVSDPVTGQSFRENAVGLYAYGEYGIDRHWSAGAFFDWLERRFDSGEHWTGGGVFVTWKIDEFNRLRLQTQLVNDTLLSDRYFALMLQWTTLIGSHAHPLAW